MKLSGSAEVGSPQSRLRRNDMSTIKEMAKFVEQLPEDTIAVLVVQRGRHPTVVRTENLDLPVIFPNWPKACWLGMTDAINGEPPTSDSKEGEGNGSAPRNLS